MSLFDYSLARVTNPLELGSLMVINTHLGHIGEAIGCGSKRRPRLLGLANQSSSNLDGDR